MQRVARDQVIYRFAAGQAPAARVQPGERFVLETQDAYGGRLRRETDRFDPAWLDTANPCTGPIYVAGAAPGDALVVSIHAIALGERGVMCVRPGAGALAHHLEDEEVRIAAIADGVALIDRLEIPLAPMVGVLGVAPAGEAAPTLLPGAHGGNLDCRLIAPGSKVYLPVAVEGALLAAGDLHAVMGDGEVGVCGLEVAGEIELSAQVVPESRLPISTIAGDDLMLPRLAGPVVETPTHWCWLASAATLDTAVEQALDCVVEFFRRRAGRNAQAIARLLSLAGNLEVCQVVNPLKTVRVTLPKAVTDQIGLQFS